MKLFVFKLLLHDIKTIHFKTFIIIRTTETLIIGLLKLVIYGNHYLGNTHIQLSSRVVSITCGFYLLRLVGYLGLTSGYRLWKLRTDDIRGTSALSILFLAFLP